MILETYLERKPPESAVISLHGYTGDEYSMRPVAIGVRAHYTKWLIPRGPFGNRTNKGYSWFSGNDDSGWDSSKSFEILSELLGRLFQEGFPAEKIFFMGFSQGACLCMEFMARLPYSMGGVIPICGFIKYPEKLRSESTPESRKTPVHLFHGMKDELVPLSESESAQWLLSDLGHDVMLTPYRAGHKISSAILPAIRTIIEGT